MVSVPIFLVSFWWLDNWTTSISKIVIVVNFSQKRAKEGKQVNQQQGHEHPRLTDARWFLEGGLKAEEHIFFSIMLTAECMCIIYKRKRWQQDALLEVVRQTKVV